MNAPHYRCLYKGERTRPSHTRCAGFSSDYVDLMNCWDFSEVQNETLFDIICFQTLCDVSHNYNKASAFRICGRTVCVLSRASVLLPKWWTRRGLYIRPEWTVHKCFSSQTVCSQLHQPESEWLTLIWSHFKFIKCLQLNNSLHWHIC